MTETIQENNTQNETQNQPEKLDSSYQKQQQENKGSSEDTPNFIKSDENKENWRAFREQREKQRKELEKVNEEKRRQQEQIEALKAALEVAIAKPQQQQSNNDSYYEDDDVAQQKKLQKMVQEALEADRKRVEEEKRRKEEAEMPVKLQSTYRDFSQVCTQENLDYLDYYHPEISKAFLYMPNSYEKWESVYKAVKKLVPYENKNDSARIEQNQRKPQSYVPSLTDKAPKQEAWILSDERKRANWARMQKEMK